MINRMIWKASFWKCLLIRSKKDKKSTTDDIFHCFLREMSFKTKTGRTNVQNTTDFYYLNLEKEHLTPNFLVAQMHLILRMTIFLKLKKKERNVLFKTFQIKEKESQIVRINL